MNDISEEKEQVEREVAVVEIECYPPAWGKKTYPLSGLFPCGQQLNRFLDSASARLRLLGLFDGPRMLLLMRVAERLPEPLGLNVFFKSASEIFRRCNDTRRIVALHDDADHLAAFYSRAFSHRFVDDH